MTGGLSLRTRVLAGMGAVVVTLVVVAIAITSLTRQHLTDQLDETLKRAANGPSVQYPGAGNSNNNNGDADDNGDQWPNPPAPRIATYIEGRCEATAVEWTYRSAASSSDELPAIDCEALADMAANGSVRTLSSESGRSWRATATIERGTLTIVGVSLDDVRETVRRLIAVEAIALGATAVVLGLVSWWVIRLGIRPVKQMTTTAAAIAAGDLSQRVPDLPESTEAGQLGLALNHMMEQLERAFNERARSQQRLQQFVADASHELRTPVTTIRGYAELYRLGGLGHGEQLSEAMRRTEEEAVRMSRLVDDMLSLAKFDEGRPLEHRNVDLARIVTDAAADARAVQPDRHVTVDAPAPAVASGDEDRLRQVVANIVGNALVHTPAGTPIELAARVTDSSVVVTVTDHGPGMTADVAAKVTERFYRADPGRARARGGSGLGMAIVDAAVAAHGGSVAVTSDVGAGTIVTVTLPRLMPPPARSANAPDPAP